MDFLWHELSDKEKEEINKQAKEIMDSFSEKLSEIDSSKLTPEFVERDDFERSEGDVENCEIDREVMFENAPNSNENFIVGEKKGW